MSTAYSFRAHLKTSNPIQTKKLNITFSWIFLFGSNFVLIILFLWLRKILCKRQRRIQDCLKLFPKKLNVESCWLFSHKHSISDVLNTPVNNFNFINQSKGWTLDNGTLDFSLFYSDGLHLVQKGNLKLGKSILKAIASTITGSRIPSRYKNAVC